MVEKRLDAKWAGIQMPVEWWTARPFEYWTNENLLCSHELVQYSNDSTKGVALKPTI